jgi:hypothetical protein
MVQARRLLLVVVFGLLLVASMLPSAASAAAGCTKEAAQQAGDEQLLSRAAELYPDYYEDIAANANLRPTTHCAAISPATASATWS